MDSQTAFADSYDCLLKILVIGNEYAGKSSLIQRFVDGTYTQDSTRPTIGIDFRLKYTEKDGKRLLLQIWDASGQPKYRNIVRHFYAPMMGIILVFDITSTSSLAALGGWIEDVRQHAFPGTQVSSIGCTNKSNPLNETIKLN